MTQQEPTALSYMLTIRLTADEKTRPQLLDSLKGIQETVRAHPRCDHYCLHQSLSNPGKLALIGEWQTQEAMNEHIRSEAFRVVLAAIDLSSEKPEICFDKLVSREGLEYLQGLNDAD